MLQRPGRRSGRERLVRGRYNYTPLLFVFFHPMSIVALKYIAGCRVLDSIGGSVGIAAIAAVWSHEKFFARG